MSDTYTDENKSLNQKGKKTKSLAKSFGTKKRENKNRDCQVLKSIRAFFKSVKKMLPMESCDEFWVQWSVEKPSHLVSTAHRPEPQSYLNY